MNSAGTPVRAMLDEWRERGADRLDPVRFRLIEALDRRAAAHRGEARRLLDERLSALLKDYASHLDRAASTDDAGGAASPCSPVRGGLAGLLDYIASHAPAQEDSPAGKGAHQPAVDSEYPAFPELKLLDYFRATWSRVSIERQMRRSLDQVPKNAGPLNSNSLVHRSLSLMRELSPAYLEQFLSYADALSWMEQMNRGGRLEEKAPPRAASAQKSKRGRTR